MPSTTELNASLDCAEAATTELIDSLIFCNCVPMVFDCRLDVSESFLISSATTAKPLPASPAFAGAVALTNFKKLMRSPFFMSFQVYKLIFINKCPKKVYTKKALNGFCKAILIFLNLCTF